MLDAAREPHGRHVRDSCRVFLGGATMTPKPALTSKWFHGALALLPARRSTSATGRRRTWARVLGALLVAAGAAFDNPAHAQNYTEFEPNNTCIGAQSLLGASFPLRVEGYKTQSDADAVDYFRFAAAPGTRLRVTLTGDPTKSNPLTAYVIGLFPSNCPSSPSAISASIFSPANLDIVVPDDGTFVIGVTACCDLDFSGSGTIEGAYLLSLGPNMPVKSIGGLVTDKISGVPLPGAAEPFAWVDLYRWGLFGPEYVAGMPTSNKGQYLFSSEATGSPLTPGDYQIVAFANQYQSTDSTVDLRNVQAGEARTAPTVGLLSNPVRFSDIRPCADVPSQGGDCNFSYRVTVGTGRPLRGGVWSLVNAWGTGGLINATKFLSCEYPINLIAGTPAASQVVQCRFTIPASVPDYAGFCVDARFGEGSRANPHFAVQGLIDPLFCLSKLPAQTLLKVVPQGPAARKVLRTGGDQR
jgi:hypothetical protein